MNLHEAEGFCVESEAEHLSPVHWCCVAYEAVSGRWVAWCVAHGSRLNDDDTCDTAHFHSDICVEHPQGAFIPDEGGTK